jgi:hypothetical protein
MFVTTYLLNIGDWKTRLSWWRTPCNHVQHGFVRATGGSTKSFDPSGSIATIPQSINGVGSIAGTYLDSGGVEHGFVRTR